MKKKVLIIGAGTAGCAAVHKLNETNEFNITIIDKADHLGAGVRTFFNGGHPFTFGPRHFLTQNKEAYDYLKKFIKLRDVSYHKFISYIRQDDNFYNYPLNVKDLEKMPDKKRNSLSEGC